MIRILLLLVLLALAGCIEEPSGSSFVPADEDLGDTVSDLGVDAGDVADGPDMAGVDMAGADMADPDMALECSECDDKGDGSYFTSCSPCEFECEDGFEKCEDGCVAFSEETTMCGGCTPQDCTVGDLQNAAPVCSPEYECVLMCEENFEDRDGDYANGCECAIDIDVPGNGEDENCDGFDGIASEWIFVSNQTGDDANDGLTPDTAVASLDTAVVKAREAQPRRTKIVLEGTAMPYESSVELEAESLEIVGGYSVVDDVWTPGNGRSRLATTDPGQPVMTIRNLGASNVVRLQSLELRGPNAAADGAAVYTMRLEQIARTDALVFDRITVFGGRGGDGVAGTRGANGPPGGNGDSGNDSTTPQSGMPENPGGDGGTSQCGSPGGKGGNATRCDAATADPGDDGQFDNMFLAGTGGAGGNNECTTGGPAVDGKTGTEGSSGGGGDKAPLPSGPRGTFDANLVWAPAVLTKADDGVHGEGGGGGGGGGSKGFTNLSGSKVTNYFGPGGSGGGGGGCGGEGGDPGQPGGASIAIAIVGSTLDLTGLTVNLGKGGDGGDGGHGGCGGTGGSAGLRASNSNGTGEAGPGGKGGNGGSGGGGNGGPGGPAYGIVHRDSTANVNQVTYIQGTRSTGGARGQSGRNADGSPCTGITQGTDGDAGSDGSDQDSLSLPL